MRALVQRVDRASVTITPGASGEVVGAIDRGLLVLVGVTHTDDEQRAEKLAEKIWHLRIFPNETDPDETDPDEAGPDESRMQRAAGMQRAVGDAAGGALLVVSQFTLYGNVGHGRRPSWAAAAPPPDAEAVIEAFVAALRGLGANVATGRFGARMSVESVNDGPVTLLVDL